MVVDARYPSAMPIELNPVLFCSVKSGIPLPLY
jgi:hypothetical protein